MADESDPVDKKKIPYSGQLETFSRPKNHVWRAFSTSGEPSFPAKKQLPNNVLLKKIQAFFDSNFERDVQVGTAVNLIPLGVGAGSVLYLSLPREPEPLAMAFMATVLILLYFRQAGRGVGYYTLAALCSLIAGICATQFHVGLKSSPTIQRQITTELGGVILLADRNSRGLPRYVIIPDKVGDLQTSHIPDRLRISSTSRKREFLPGEYIKGVARIAPVSGPVIPGGYDFSFHAWFSGLGGTGFFLGTPINLDRRVDLKWQEDAIIRINSMRRSIDKRILEALPGKSGMVAAALITGNRSLIPSDVQELLRATGLAHILAISGLHMSLVTLTILGMVRLCAAMHPGFVQKVAVKKWAAAVALLGATIYLMISGASVATQRAWIMIGVMLIATMLDRRAVTMRSVAVAGLVILLLQPESVTSPGFQMSFAAVLSLVAGYEMINNLREKKSFSSPGDSPFRKFLGAGQGAVAYLAGILFSSLVAGTATAFISAWHFQHLAPLGLLANLLAMPVVGFVVMPFALFSVLLLPYGLEFLALWPVGLGIDYILATSSWVNSFPVSGSTGLLPRPSLIYFWSFLSVLTMFRSKLRLFCIIPAAVGILTWYKPAQPDLIISENGRAIAMTLEGGNGLYLAKSTSRSFVAKNWERAWGLNARPTGEETPICSKDHCRYTTTHGKNVEIVFDPDLIQQSCESADILIAPRLWWINCYNRVPDLIIKRHDFELKGTHTFYFEADGTTIINTGLSNQNRPWSRTVNQPETVSDIDGSTPQAAPVP